MKDGTALIFGYNKFGQEIAQSVLGNYERIIYFTKDVENHGDLESDVDIRLFDLTDDWDELNQTIDVKKSIAFCVMSDEAENVFLTISLRAHFQDLIIVAVAVNQESVHKLKMAGANKVIPIVETMAGIITNILEKPISSKVLHDILYAESNLKIAQIEVNNAEIFDNLPSADIDWSRYHGIIVLSVMHKDFSTEFIYSSKSRHKKLNNGDILIVVGYEIDIDEFEKIIGSKRNVDWSDWGR